MKNTKKELIRACLDLKKNYTEKKQFTKSGWKTDSALKASIRYGKAYNYFREEYGYDKPLPKQCRFKLSNGKSVKY